MHVFYSFNSGHKSAVSVLRFDGSGGRLVSGSRVISWLFLSYIKFKRQWT